MIFPFIDSIENIKDEELKVFKEIAWDFKNNEPILVDGEFKIVEKDEAIKVWVYKALLTDRFEFEIYSWDYGCEINSLIGKGFSKSVIISEVERYIEEAILINEYIESSQIINIDVLDDKIEISIKLNTVYGEVDINVQRANI